MIALDVDRDRLHDFCRRWKITAFALFGSITRPDEFRDDSDVDVLATFAPDAPWTLFDWVHMEEELAAIFGRRVDLVERVAVEKSDNRFRKHSILGTAVELDVA